MTEWKEVFLYRKAGKGIMSNYDVCGYYGTGICQKSNGKSRPCGTCGQFKY